jgi:hypothetical protein
MADAMNDPVFAKACRELAARGGAYVDRELFNGRYRPSLRDHFNPWGVVERNGWIVTLTVKGGEPGVSRLRLPGLSGVATVEGQAAERNGDVILLGRHHTLQAGESLVVGVDAYYGQA